MNDLQEWYKRIDDLGHTAPAEQNLSLMDSSRRLQQDHSHHLHSLRQITLPSLYDFLFHCQHGLIGAVAW